MARPRDAAFKSRIARSRPSLIKRGPQHQLLMLLKPFGQSPHHKS
jgi:hypothetical protein